MTMERMAVVLLAGIFLATQAGVAGAEPKSELDPFCSSQLEQCKKDCEVAAEGTEIRLKCDAGCLQAWDECEEQANKSGPAGSRVGGARLPAKKYVPGVETFEPLTQPKVQPGGVLQ
jgi:hypothetical protein